MTEKEAKKIGSYQTLIAIGISLICLQLIHFWLSWKNGVITTVLWFTPIIHELYFKTGTLILLISGFAFGRLAGIEILIKKRNCITIGILCAEAVFITTIFTASCSKYLQEIISPTNVNDHLIEEYIFYPVVM
jgi:hypothetical protein